MAKRKVPRARIVGIDEIPADRPVVTLDIDGVLNAFDHGRPRYSWQRPAEDEPVPYDITDVRRVTLPGEMCDECGYRHGQSFEIAWSADLMADIAELAESGKATIVWLTSWNDFADWLWATHLRPDSPSPAFGCLDCTAGRTCSSHAGKVRVLRELCDMLEAVHPDGDAPPVVSFDDDAPWDYQGWGRSERLLPDFFHGVRTDPRYGITMSQWDGMLELIDESE